MVAFYIACPRLWNSGVWFEVREREKKNKEKEGERGRNFALTPYPTPCCFFCTHLLASSSQSELLEQELTLLHREKRCISRSLIFKIFPGASEMLAMEMKASGMYVSRGLSFRQAEVIHNVRNGILIFCCNRSFSIILKYKAFFCNAYFFTSVPVCLTNFDNAFLSHFCSLLMLRRHWLHNR